MRATGRAGHTGRGASARVPALRLLCALFLSCLLPCAASAYTIIMRGGRRVEAPARFVVTRTTLTYEAAPGLNVTLQLSQIDIAATERANNEPPGSLLRRAESVSAAPEATTLRPAARTLTNRELEPARRARLESERAYEQRRRELGLPAPQDERRSAEAEAKALSDIARRQEAEDAQAESYWRARAAALREEATVLDAEIDYLRTRLADESDYFAPSYGALIATGSPFFAARRFPSAVPWGGVNSTGFGTTTQLGGSVVVGGTTGGHIFFNQQSATGTFRRRIIGAPGLFAPPGAVVAVPFNYANADAATLRVRLVELEAARAGLSARWQQLEDEARRAGALPGWLRP